MAHIFLVDSSAPLIKRNDFRTDLLLYNFCQLYSDNVQRGQCGPNVNRLLSLTFQYQRNIEEQCAGARPVLYRIYLKKEN